MGATLTIAKKELRSFINSPLAYIFLIIFLGFLAFPFFISGRGGVTFFSLKSAQLEYFFAGIPLAFVALIPALSMKLWPDELKSGTVELLMSYPLKNWQVVLGKFLAGLGLIAAGLLLSIATPLVVAQYGNLDWGPVIGVYLASLLMGGAFLSIGMFMGALCKEQVTAFILGFLVCVSLVVADASGIRQFYSKPVQVVMEFLSFNTRFMYLGRGVVDLKDVTYFVSFTLMFLVLNITVLECRKGR